MEMYNSAWEWRVLGLQSPSLNESVFNFNSPSVPSSYAQIEELNGSHEKSDGFADWMDEKIDLSILDGLEGQPGILDDIDMMIGDPVALLDNLIDWSSELLWSGNDVTNTKKSDPLEEDTLQVTDLSPPISPVNKVPDFKYGLLPEFEQELLYAQTSNANTSPATASTASPAESFEEADDFYPAEYVKVEYDNSGNIELDGFTPNTPPMSPESFMPSSNDSFTKQTTDVHSPSNTKLESSPSNTPPVTPVSFVPTVEYVITKNAMEAETNVSIGDLEHSPNSFVLDAPFNCKSNDNESHKLSTVSIKEYNSGNTSLRVEFEADVKADVPVKRRRSHKKVVSTSDPPVPVEVRRKERKRVQNKDAATRYREKRRKEGKAATDEQLELENQNRELHNTVDRLANEISYLKGLLNEAKLRAQSRKKHVI